MVTGEMGTDDAEGVVPSARRARTAAAGNGHEDVRLVAERATSDSIGARLRARREAHGISLRQFARQLDVSASFISQLETGKAKPSVATLYSICAALDMSIDELFAVEPPTSRDRDAAVAVGAEQGVSTSAGLRDTLLRGWGGSPGEDRVRSPLVSPDERRALVLDSGVTWQRLTATNHMHSDFMFVRYDVGGSSTSDGRLVRHPGTEYGFVISGTLEVTLGFETYRMNPGDSISFDSEVPHRLCNVGDVPVEAIWFDQHYAHGE
ncbi:MAG: helix-turn-helix transcriptional regulator [Acidobacteriota bacterium]|nr:helix-turn-helix transcriptional regulator [Acidobacteriota bacterium]